MTTSNKLGWRLAAQAWSFHHFTLFEAIDKTAALGLKYIEAYPGQALSPVEPETVFDPNLDAAGLEKTKAKLRSAGISLVNFGVVNLPNNEMESRKVFEFAKEMGIETIVSEPPLDAFDLLDRLCADYAINVAIHNHPAPSPYWNPDTVLAACKGRSARIGACADTGHWVRSGIDPLEAMRKLEGRIISFHSKDVDVHSPEAQDVPWGTGIGDMKGQLEEIRRQGIKPVISIEYELPTNADPQCDMAKCIAYYESVCGTL
ncbi:MAG: sugar phosphate isomerase/epimerase [Candidatus Hydrogenedentes bacterium]|nr:sugar phosphate isomerase/epimerase [Candidatus Hydrogenedentota bacterium]